MLQQYKLKGCIKNVVNNVDMFSFRASSQNDLFTHTQKQQHRTIQKHEEHVLTEFFNIQNNQS